MALPKFEILFVHLYGSMCCQGNPKGWLRLSWPKLHGICMCLCETGTEQAGRAMRGQTYLPAEMLTWIVTLCALVGS